MRIRYEMYRNGSGTGTQVICDMKGKEAAKKFDELFNNLKCGWAELVGEDDDNYMDIIRSFDHIAIAKKMTMMFG